ncbi:MAG: PH domain-containing protein [Gammaproteobacteria bacterium]|nr:PH domain-containing protein [Gammaproteobacteria bacterium]
MTHTDSGWCRLHPSAMLGRASIVFLILLASFIATVLTDAESPGITTILVGGLIGILVVGAIVSIAFSVIHNAFRYQFLNDRVLLRIGLLSINHRSILYERLHGIDTSQTPIHRLFGTLRVSLQTSGGRGSEAQLEAVRPEVVEELRSLVAAYKKQHKTEDAVSLSEPASVSKEACSTSILYSLKLLDCLKLATVRTQIPIIIAAIVGFLMSQSDLAGLLFRAFLPSIDLTNLISVSLGEGWIPWIEISLNDQIRITDLIVNGATLAGFAFALLFVSSVFFAIVLYYRFQLQVVGEVLTAESGWIVRSRQNTPLHRIQAVKVVKNLRTRVWRRESIWFSTSAAEQGRLNLASPLNNWLAPLVKPMETISILKNTMPNVAIQQSTWQSIDVSTATRRRFKRNLVFVIPITVLALLISPWLLLVTPILLAWAYYAAKKIVQSLAHQVSENAIMLRKGWLNRIWAIVPFDKVQAVRVTQSPFDRRFNMANLCVDTASYHLGLSRWVIRIPYMDAQRAHEIRRLLAKESALRELEW